MPTNEQLLSQVSVLTNRLNAIENNAKKSEELPVMSTIVPESLVRVSQEIDEVYFSKTLTIQQIIDAATFIMQNQIISIGEITIVDNDITIPVCQWMISGVNYLTTGDTVINVPFATTGFSRIDIIVANTSNVIYKISGIESDAVAVRPNIPLNTVLVTQLNVTDNAIDTIYEPISENILNALNAANSPSASNPFATQSDIVSGTTSNLAQVLTIGGRSKRYIGTDSILETADKSKILVWDNSDSYLELPDGVANSQDTFIVINPENTTPPSLMITGPTTVVYYNGQILVELDYINLLPTSILTLTCIATNVYVATIIGNIPPITLKDLIDNDGDYYGTNPIQFIESNLRAILKYDGIEVKNTALNQGIKALFDKLRFTKNSFITDLLFADPTANGTVTIKDTAGIAQTVAFISDLEAIQEGLSWKTPAKILIDSNQTQSGSLPVLSSNIQQGVTLTVNDRVVFAGQTDQTINGIYRYTGLVSGTHRFSRASDANATNELNNAIIAITNGTYANKTFRQTTPNPAYSGSLFTDNIVFADFGNTISQATNIAAGIMKLYTSLGTNTDGTLDQNTLKTLFDGKARKAVREALGDSNTTIGTTTTEAVTSAALTANRTHTLPSGLTGGQSVVFIDEYQAIGTNKITIAVPSGKKLNGVVNGTVDILNKGGSRVFYADGNDNFYYDLGIVRSKNRVDYSSLSTINGWTSFTYYYIYYLELDNCYQVWWGIYGNSGSGLNFAKFTLPFTNPTNMPISSVARAINGGSGQSNISSAVLSPGENVVNLYIGYSGSWSTLSVKATYGQMMVPKN